MLVYKKSTVILLSRFEYPFEFCGHELKVKTVGFRGSSKVPLNYLSAGMENWMVESI